MSKHVRERMDSASIKKYQKNKIKQQMYSFNQTGSQVENITRNDVHEVGYKTQQHSPLGFLNNQYAQQVKNQDGHHAKPINHVQNMTNQPKQGQHERQSSHLIPVSRIESGHPQLGHNKSKKGIVHYPFQQEVHTQQNSAQRVQSPIIVNQKGKKVAAGNLRQSMNNANHNITQSNSPTMYPEQYGNSNYQLVASLVQGGEDLVQQKKFWTQQNSFQNTPRSKKRALQQMGNQRMKPPNTKTFYNINHQQHKKVNSIDGIEYQQAIQTQMTMPNHLQPTNQIRNLRNTINNKTNIQSQANTQINPNQKLKVQGQLNQSITMKGTPELKAKGIIIANNKQISNFTKSNPTSQQLYENKVEEPLLGNLSNQNVYFQKQKQTGNFNNKPKGAVSTQNQWFVPNDGHQNSGIQQRMQSPPQLMNHGPMNAMTSPQNYLGQINNVQPDPNVDSQGVSPLISPNEQNRNRMVKNMSQMNKHQNIQYNNSRDARNFQGNLGGALNVNGAGGNISRNYGQKHPHENLANTTGTKKPNLQNMLQNKATLPQLSISASPSNQKGSVYQQQRQPSSKVIMTQKRKTDQISNQKPSGTRPTEGMMPSDKSTHIMSQSNGDQVAMHHIYGAHVKQATHHADLKTRPPLNNPDVHYFVTDGDFVDEKLILQQQFNNFQAHSNHQSRVSQDRISNQQQKAQTQARPQSKGSSAKISLQKNRKYATNRQLVKNSEDFLHEQKMNTNPHSKDRQPVVQMNLMNGLDSRNNMNNSLIQNEQKQANTCYQTKQNSRQISPNRSQGRGDGMRARSYHTTDLHSQSIKSGNMASVSNQKVSMNYNNLNQSNKNNLSNTGIQIKKQQVSNNNQRQRSIVGHHNSPISKNEATKVINDIKRKQLNEKSGGQKRPSQLYNQNSIHENTQTGSQMDEHENSFDEPQNQGMRDSATQKVQMKKETLDELASSRSGASNSRNSKSGKPVELENRDKYGMNKAMRDCVLKKYELKSIIGKGSYGCVTKAKCRRTGREVALKVMQQQSQTEYEIIKLLREILILRRLNEITYELQRNEKNKASFIPELIEIICPEDTSHKRRKSAQSKSYDLMNICLVIEFVDTDLDSLLKHKIDFTENHLIKLIYNILCCLAFLHMCNVMHRDLKPANILIQSNCSVRVCDFGLSRSLPDSCSNRVQQERVVNQQVYNKTFKNSLYLRQDAIEKFEGSEEKQRTYVKDQLIGDRERRKTMQRNMSLHVGSRWYRAPEISLVEKQYDFSSDLWSLGCIIHELIQYLQYSKGEQNFRKEFQRIRYLYQGNSCFPLSPCDKNDDDKDKKDSDKNSEEKVHVISKDDQNLVILKDLGLQSETDLSFLTSKHAINYVKELEQSLQGSTNQRIKKISPIEKRADMMAQKLTPGAEEITDIMKNFLQLNPFLRWTAYECLQKCQIFNEVRVRTREVFLKKLYEISVKGYQQRSQRNRLSVKNQKSHGNPNQNVQSVGGQGQKSNIVRGVIYNQGGQQVATNSATNSNQEQIRSHHESQSPDDQAIFKKLNVNQNNKDIDYHIELLIDSSDAFDYEDLKNAKYQIDDLKEMLIEQIQYYETQNVTQ